MIDGVIVDRALLDRVLSNNIKVLNTMSEWNNSDDFLWIQYSDELMRKDIATLRTALAEQMATRTQPSTTTVDLLDRECERAANIVDTMYRVSDMLVKQDERIESMQQQLAVVSTHAARCNNILSRIEYADREIQGKKNVPYSGANYYDQGPK